MRRFLIISLVGLATFALFKTFFRDNYIALVFTCVILFFFSLILISGSNRKQLSQLETDYNFKLQQFKEDPTQSNHGLAFKAGRAYSSQARKITPQERTPVFTEAMLTSDLAAFRHNNESSQKSIKSRLEELDELLAADLIIYEEYKELRQQILDSV